MGLCAMKFLNKYVGAQLFLSEIRQPRECYAYLLKYSKLFKNAYCTKIKCKHLYKDVYRFIIINILSILYQTTS